MRIPILPLLAAFACGVCVLQTRASLPAHPWALAAGGMLTLALALVATQARTSRGMPPPATTQARLQAQTPPPLPCVRPRAPIATLLALAAATVLGLGYAACRAELRLAD